MKCSELNEMLDQLMDGTLSEDDRRTIMDHGRTCPQCAAQIRATLHLQEMLSQMEDEVAVPLPAQNKWRQAVRAEASRRKMGRIYRFGGAVAAAVVLIAGIGWAFNSDAMLPRARQDAAVIQVGDNDLDADDKLASSGVAVVEADGQEAVSSTARAVTDGAPMHERLMHVENIEDACGYICDLVAEYEGSAEEQRFVESGMAQANLYITMPAANINDFLSATAHLNASGESVEPIEAVAEETASLLLVLVEG